MRGDWRQGQCLVLEWFEYHALRITPLSTDSQYVIAGQSLASELAFFDFKSKTRLPGLRLFDRGLNR
jgi:hypothetical protein